MGMHLFGKEGKLLGEKGSERIMCDLGNLLLTTLTIDKSRNR